jgi:hypothetical protein
MSFQLSKRMKDYANAIIPFGFCIISTSEFDEVSRRIIIDRKKTIEEIERIKEMLPEVPEEVPAPFPVVEERKKKKDRWDWDGLPRKQKLVEKFKQSLSIVKKHAHFDMLM